jgi:Xaa-Pro aminopeptidase
MKPGLFEYELQAEYNYVLNKNRTTPSFDTIAASGKNATVLHYIDNDSKIPENQLVLFDLGVDYDYYCSDVTRTIPSSGKFTKRQKEVYEVVLEANKKSIEWLRPGVTIKEFNDYGKKILIEGAKKLGLIKEDSEISKYYYHSLGHYLGLDVHDVGNYAKPIPEGALITIEPGLYIAEEGIGIRIEDDVVVTKDGAINLTKDIIKEVADIEAFMKK